MDREYVTMISWQLSITATLGLVFAFPSHSQSQDQTSHLPTPGFHHLHLNSPDPDAAIDFYTKQFPSTSKSIWGGFPALKTGKVFVLFAKVNSPAPTEPRRRSGTSASASLTCAGPRHVSTEQGLLRHGGDPWSNFALKLRPAHMYD
jgi:hypothetical protein